MIDFKSFLNDFSHLVSGASSVAGGMKSEIDNNMQSLFNNFASQAGFVRRDEFDTLSERFAQAVQTIKMLEATIHTLKETTSHCTQTETH